MTILVLGGRGKTSTELAKLLDAENISFIIASRSPSSDGSSQHVRFDWLDDSTYDFPFEAATEPVTAIYLVAPEVSDPFPPMKGFIDHARRKGTKRFVLLSATAIPKGGPAYGKVHEYLETLGVEYGVLRPTWFMGMSKSYMFCNFLALTDINREFHRQENPTCEIPRRVYLLRNARWKGTFRGRQRYCRGRLSFTHR